MLSSRAMIMKKCYTISLARYGTSCSAPEGWCIVFGRSQLSLASEVGDVDLSFQLINMRFVDIFKSRIACRQLLSFYPTGYLLSLLAHSQVFAVHYAEFFPNRFRSVEA